MSDMTNYPDPPNPPVSAPARADAPGNPPGPNDPTFVYDEPGIAHPGTAEEPPEVAQPQGIDMITIAGGSEEPGETV